MWRTTTVLLILALAILGGCKKKKPQLPPQQQAPPTITQPQPPVVEPKPAGPAPQPTDQPNANTTKPSVPASPSAKTPRRTAKKTTPAPKPAPKPPTRVIVENDDEPARPVAPLSASVSGNAVTEQRRATEHLLQSAELNLKELNRTLTTDEETFVRRVRSFMAQSRTAAQQGDHERAYNLALKAQLLSEELLKR